MGHEVSKIQAEIRNAREAIVIQEHREELGSSGCRGFLKLAETECISPEYCHYLEWEIEALEKHIRLLEDDILVLKGRE